MAQINIYTYLSQTTWTIILFGIYYVIMKQILLPSLLEAILLQSFDDSEERFKRFKIIRNYKFSYLNI